MKDFTVPGITSYSDPLGFFTVRAESEPNWLYILHFDADSLVLTYAQRKSGTVYHRGWMLTCEDEATDFKDYTELSNLPLARAGERLLGLGPLESDIWAHDVEVAAEPLVLQAQRAVAAGRWATFAYELKQVQP